MNLHYYYRCHYTKSNPIDDHCNISSKRLQNFKLLGHYSCMQCRTSHLQRVHENILSHIISGFTLNKITLTTIVTYLQNGCRSRISNHSLYLHAVWYLPFTNSPRKHTVTYHFSGLQAVYSGNRQIHTKSQLQYLYPPQISTSVKCHCVIIHQTTKATEYIG